MKICSSQHAARCFVRKAKNIGIDVRAATTQTMIVLLTLRRPLSERYPATGTISVKITMADSTIQRVSIVGRPACVTKNEGSQEYPR